jgi:hypothetical protein
MFDNENLNLPSLEWIGLKLSDIERYLPEKSEECCSKLSDADKRIAKSLISKFVSLNEHDLVREVSVYLYRIIYSSDLIIFQT